jgi:hypothetical protein
VWTLGLAASTRAAVLQSSYLGGRLGDQGYGVAVNPSSGAVYVTLVPGKSNAGSRRPFAAAAGMTWSLPSLTGCNGDGDSGVPPPPLNGRETRILHLDLSNHAPEALYCIHAIGSRTNLAEFTLHDDESRTRALSSSPRLRHATPARLTHYLDAVDLPADRVQHIWVTREDAAGSTMVLSALYVPRYYRIQAARSARSKSTSTASATAGSPRCRSTTSTARRCAAGTASSTSSRTPPTRPWRSPTRSSPTRSS